MLSYVWSQQLLGGKKHLKGKEGKKCQIQYQASILNRTSDGGLQAVINYVIEFTEKMDVKIFNKRTNKHVKKKMLTAKKNLSNRSTCHSIKYCITLKIFY